MAESASIELKSVEPIRPRKKPAEKPYAPSAIVRIPPAREKITEPMGFSANRQCGTSQNIYSLVRSSLACESLRILEHDRPSAPSAHSQGHIVPRPIARIPRSPELSPSCTYPLCPIDAGSKSSPEDWNTAPTGAVESSNPCSNLKPSSAAKGLRSDSDMLGW